MSTPQDKRKKTSPISTKNKEKKDVIQEISLDDIDV
jgi:hypothetical protein